MVDPPATSPMKIMEAPHPKWGDMANRLGPASQALAARRFFSSSAEEGQHRRRTTRLMRALAARHSFRRRRAAPPQHRRAWKIGRGAPLRKKRSTSTPPRGLKVERGERASALSRKKGGYPTAPQEKRGTAAPPPQKKEGGPPPKKREHALVNSQKCMQGRIGGRSLCTGPNNVLPSPCQGTVHCLV